MKMHLFLKQELLDWFEEVTGANDWVDDGRAQRKDVWGNDYGKHQAICELIETFGSNEITLTNETLDTRGKKD